MPNTRTKILQQIFKRGVETFPREEINQLFNEAKNKFYRVQTEPSPEHWIRRGWISPEKTTWGMAEGEPTGVYWSPSRSQSYKYLRYAHPETAGAESIKELKAIMREDLPNYREDIVEGLIRPNASIADIPLGATKYPDVDFLRRRYNTSLINDPYPTNFDEYIQTKPGNMLVRYKNLIRILGLTGAFPLLREGTNE